MNTDSTFRLAELILQQQRNDYLMFGDEFLEIDIYGYK